MKSDAIIIVSVTWPNHKKAEKAVQILVEEKLVACAQLIESITSYYFWHNKLTKDIECLSLLKTRSVLYKKLEKRVKELHSYEVPEIIACPIIKGAPDYLHWVSQNTKE